MSLYLTCLKLGFNIHLSQNDSDIHCFICVIVHYCAGHCDWFWKEEGKYNQWVLALGVFQCRKKELKTVREAEMTSVGGEYPEPQESTAENTRDS